MINYLIGFYVSLSEAIFLSSQCSRDDRRSAATESERDLLYNIHIRLGDLYRYVDSRTNAKLYYQKALEIDSRKGTAYNQLALCTPLTKPFSCLYFSVRAAKASIEPIKFADSNIRMAISKLNSPIFARFRTDLSVELDANAIDVPSPVTGADWFYLVVISIYFNDFNLTLPLLLDHLLGIIDGRASDNNFDYGLMAFDVALDWILKGKPIQWVVGQTCHFSLLFRSRQFAKC